MTLVVNVVARAVILTAGMVASHYVIETIEKRVNKKHSKKVNKQ